MAKETLVSAKTTMIGLRRVIQIRDCLERYRLSYCITSIAEYLVCKYSRISSFTLQHLKIEPFPDTRDTITYLGISAPHLQAIVARHTALTS